MYTIAVRENLPLHNNYHPGLQNLFHVLLHHIPPIDGVCFTF